MWELDYKESWASKNWCFWTVVLERTLESPLDSKTINQQGSNQSILKDSFLNIHWNNWWWSWNSNPLATWCEDLTHWKRPWCWEGLRAGGEGDGSGWDGWMASPTQITWVWVYSGSWWWTGRPGLLQPTGLQRVRLTWTELMYIPYFVYPFSSKHSIVFLLCAFMRSVTSVMFNSLWPKGL